MWITIGAWNEVTFAPDPSVTVNCTAVLPTVNPPATGVGGGDVVPTGTGAATCGVTRTVTGTVNVPGSQ